MEQSAPTGEDMSPFTNHTIMGTKFEITQRSAQDPVSVARVDAEIEEH